MTYLCLRCNSDVSFDSEQCPKCNLRFTIGGKPLVDDLSKNKYQREVPSTTIDVYDVLKAFNVTNPATAHAVKKLLAPGQRGVKDEKQDLTEAMDSIKRAIELI